MATEPDELRVEAAPFRVAAHGVTREQLDRFLAKAQSAWCFVLEELVYEVAEGWPTDWPTFLPRVVDVLADDAVNIPQIRWGREQILYSVPAAKLRAGLDSCVAHELTHLLAPGFHQPDDLLREGLAVHLQALFDLETDDRSYPTLGADLHEQTRSLIEVCGGRIPLREAEATRERSLFGPGRQLAYLEAGSFVRFLLERHDMPTYMRIHDGEGFETVLGRDFDALERDWSHHLKR